MAELFNPVGPTNEISFATRLNVMDYLAVEGFDWSGRLGEIRFLRRIFDLRALPSEDLRFRTAEEDIHQHCVRNSDWEPDWIFQDRRFNLIGCPDPTFLKFMCEILHPVVRYPSDDLRDVLLHLNQCLATDGWELIPASTIGGRSAFEAQKIGWRSLPPLKIEPSRFDRIDDPKVLHDHFSRIERDIESDPSAAIGSAKELFESTCKVILDDFGVSHKGVTSLPELYKLVQNELCLNSEAVAGNSAASRAAVRTLRGMTQAVQGLAELRNQIGTGHGQSKRSTALARHARLAAGNSRVLSEFLLETWHERRRTNASARKATA